MAERRQRDKEQTIRDILAAARRLFSENGLHGTSLRDIEEASGVSKGLIIHHFECKENLYAVVQDLLLQEYTAWMAARGSGSTDMKDRITAAVEQALAYSKENKDYRRIALWSYLEGQDRNSELGKSFTTNLIGAMRAGQEAGLVRDDIDAFLMPFLVKGTIEYWIRTEDLREEISAAAQCEVVSDSDLVEALVRLLLK